MRGERLGDCRHKSFFVATFYPVSGAPPHFLILGVEQDGAHAARVASLRLNPQYRLYVFLAVREVIAPEDEGIHLHHRGEPR